ncbi:MAG: energy transducer TonB [Ignavibacteriaceae bacterium]|nr:energy transducer TonB [Ignavibacteriaceae bacterium]
MNYRDIKNISYSASVLFHSILMVIFLLVNLTFEFPAKDYVELSFGISSEYGSSGAIGENLDKTEELASPQEENITENKNPEVKEVKLPVAKNTQDDNIIKPAEKDKEQKKETKTENVKETTSDVSTTGKGNLARGEGSFGFDIEWGGMGTRKIYSYSLPSYPEGVNKEIDIRLRFTIKPDGTVGSIFLLTKADTKLENAAINSLWQWRFEPLSPAQQQAEQTAVIVFPYRLQ